MADLGFPRSRQSESGAPMYYFAKLFQKNCMQIKKIWKWDWEIFLRRSATAVPWCKKTHIMFLYRFKDGKDDRFLVGLLRPEGLNFASITWAIERPIWILFFLSFVSKAMPLKENRWFGFTVTWYCVFPTPLKHSLKGTIIFLSFSLCFRFRFVSVWTSP